MINLVLDTETSGLGPKDGPCEIALIHVDDDLNVIAEYSSLIDPQVPMHPEAQKIHGISSAMVTEAPTLAEWFEIVLENRFRGETVRVIAHNAGFDVKFVRPHLNIADICCTLNLARRLFPKASSHKLDELQFYLDLPVTGRAHTALADTQTCLALLRYMRDALGGNLHSVLDYWQAPYDWSVMTWGKHQGKPLADLPRPYRRWLLTLDNLDPQLRTALEDL